MSEEERREQSWPGEAEYLAFGPDFEAGFGTVDEAQRSLLDYRGRPISGRSAIYVR